MSHPLEGVRILELGQIIAGTYGSQVLSDMGAEVIKVEAPEGDLGRNPSVAPYRGLSGLQADFRQKLEDKRLGDQSSRGTLFQAGNQSEWGYIQYAIWSLAAIPVSPIPWLGPDPSPQSAICHFRPAQ